MSEKEKQDENKIISNKSGQKYHYASLADIARQGVKIPPMRVVYTGDKDGEGNPIEYIEAYIDGADGGIGWVRGARVVVPRASNMNEAQAYGSAITYARRYTILTLLGIACDDDDKIENTKAEDAAKAELRDLYKKAGGADFDKWFEENTKEGFTGSVFASMKMTLIKQINKKAEEEKK